LEKLFERRLRRLQKGLSFSGFQGHLRIAQRLMKDPMIDIKNLTKKFAEITAVEDLTFQVEKGEIFGFLGPNGAGKTTTMRMLCCLISKTSGEAQIAGYNIGRAADALRIRKMIGLVPETVGLYEELSAYENLDFYGRLYECPEPVRKENIEYYLRLLGLWDRKNRPIGDYSKGMRQKVAIARALIHDPSMLFLDEPTANLDPESSRVVRNFILTLKQKGKTIFLNTHNLAEAQKICDRIGIIRTKLLVINSPEQLEKSVWGSKTVIHLEAVNDAILAAVRNLHPKGVGQEGNKIIVDVDNPQKENPDLAKAIVMSGGRIQSMAQLNPGLEETYMKVINETR
jgi:ABC-2 type transport system ATP-binding protein